MLMNDFTRRALAYRKGKRDLLRQGFIAVSESGDPLWRFQRGDWQRYRITDVRIGPDGQSLFIKTDAPPIRDRPPVELPQGLWRFANRTPLFRTNPHKPGEIWWLDDHA